MPANGLGRVTNARSENLTPIPVAKQDANDNYYHKEGEIKAKPINK